MEGKTNPSMIYVGAALILLNLITYLSGQRTSVLDVANSDTSSSVFLQVCSG